jgi:hypothetical protein
MTLRLATRLKSYFEEHTNENLLGVIMYDKGEFNVIYFRDDVAEEYTEQGFADALDDSRIESSCTFLEVGGPSCTQRRLLSHGAGRTISGSLSSLTFT